MVLSYSLEDCEPERSETDTHRVRNTQFSQCFRNKIFCNSVSKSTNCSFKPSIHGKGNENHFRVPFL